MKKSAATSLGKLATKERKSLPLHHSKRRQLWKSLPMQTFHSSAGSCSVPAKLSKSQKQGVKSGPWLTVTGSGAAFLQIFSCCTSSHQKSRLTESSSVAQNDRTAFLMWGKQRPAELYRELQDHTSDNQVPVQCTDLPAELHTSGPDWTRCVETDRQTDGVIRLPVIRSSEGR